MKPIAKRIAIVLVLLMVGGLALRWHLTHADDTRDIEFTLNGNIDIRQANLAFTEQERLAEVLVEEGEHVIPGQVLARLRTEQITAQIKEVEAKINAQQETVNRLTAGSRPQEIEQIQAEVNALKAQVKNAGFNFKRVQKTSGVGATSAQALDNARTQLEVYQAQLKAKQKALELAMEGPRKEDIAAARNTLKALKANLEVLKLRRNDMTLTAPVAGVIQNRILEPGELAGPSQPVFTLSLNNPKWVRAYVSEPDLGRLHPNQKAFILTDSFPEHKFKGRVGFISSVAEFTPKSVETSELRTQLVYEVRIFVTDARDQLRLGMPVTVTLDTKTKKASDQTAS
ncbi:MAG: efflux RND transporter periplasmic adaptor subunit [Desulfobacteraceae bacterium]|jgi:HlyD family secretion protein